MYDIYNMGKIKKPGEKAITKAITILPRHQKFIEEQTLNFSKFVQKKLDEEMEKRKKEGDA